MKGIPLNHGKFALVDDVDFDFLNERKWYAMRSASGKHYAMDSNGVLMHRYILSPGVQQEVDHINGNPLDNRRKNMRTCTRAENMRNRPVRKNNKSGFKGVYKRGSRFRAYIGYDGKIKQIGTFDSAEEAAIARDKASLCYHGEFANLNFI
jgi:hypothetical protein